MRILPEVWSYILVPLYEYSSRREFTLPENILLKVILRAEVSLIGVWLRHEDVLYDFHIWIHVIDTATLSVRIILYDLFLAHLSLLVEFLEEVNIVYQTVDQAVKPCYLIFVASSAEVKIFDVNRRFPLFLRRAISIITFVTFPLLECFLCDRCFNTLLFDIFTSFKGNWDPAVLLSIEHNVQVLLIENHSQPLVLKLPLHIDHTWIYVMDKMLLLVWLLVLMWQIHAYFFDHGSVRVLHFNR